MEFIKKMWDKLCETALNEDILINYLEEEKTKIEESSELNFIKWIVAPLALSQSILN